MLCPIISNPLTVIVFLAVILVLSVHSERNGQEGQTQGVNINHHSDERKNSTHLVLNAMDITGLEGSISFIAYLSRLIDINVDMIEVSLYVENMTWKQFNKPVEDIQLVNVIPFTVREYINKNRIKDKRRGMTTRTKEHVTDILTVMNDVIDRKNDISSNDNQSLSHHVLMLSFLRGSIPMPTNHFKDIVDWTKNYDLILLGQKYCMNQLV